MAEGVVANADLADIGVIMGTGFAPFLGGPMQARKDGKSLRWLNFAKSPSSARRAFRSPAANTGYAEESNLSMLGAALGGLADKYNLKGEKIDEVMAGAVHRP